MCVCSVSVGGWVVVQCECGWVGGWVGVQCECGCIQCLYVRGGPGPFI